MSAPGTTLTPTSVVLEQRAAQPAPSVPETPAAAAAEPAAPAPISPPEPVSVPEPASAPEPAAAATPAPPKPAPSPASETATPDLLASLSSFDPASFASSLSSRAASLSSSADAAFEEALSTASDRLRWGASALGTEASRAAGFARTHADDAIDVAEGWSRAALAAAREQTEVLRAHPRESAAAGALAAFVLVPSLRRGAWSLVRRATLTPAARLASASRAGAEAAARAAEQGKDAAKLRQRLDAALEEYSRGKDKVASAADEVEALHARAGATRADLERTLAELRRLPQKEAVQRRSDVANALAEAKGLEKQLAKTVKQLAKKGF